jgi:hypothetical protein
MGSTKCNTPLARRYQNTLRFLEKSLPPPANILDLGPPNRLGEIMSDLGYKVQNTHVDLDDKPDDVHKIHVDAVTAFEILEHLFSPLTVLRQITAPRLFATVPLKLWFVSAFYNPDDTRDCHYHEFEPWQFDSLLKKAGWEICRKEMWKSPSRKIGFRPLLRCFTNRYYAVEAVRI